MSCLALEEVQVTTTNASTEALLDRNLAEQVLGQMGFADKPSNDLAGLSQVYAAWCRNVPFDNARKIIHVAAQNAAPLPGDDAGDFFTNWLKHRTGATCWAGNGALQALLSSIGFNASRGVATMLISPHTPPNHGTVLVEIEGCMYWVDASMLHEIPLPLDSAKLDSLHLPYKFQLSLLENHWQVWWLPLHRLEGLSCRIDSYPASKLDFQTFHEQTRNWSPFNYELNVRKVVGEKTIGIGMGNFVELSADGKASINAIESEQERIRLLVERLGFSEEIARMIPQDRQTSPPPMSMRGHS